MALFAGHTQQRRRAGIPAPREGSVFEAPRYYLGRRRGGGQEPQLMDSRGGRIDPRVCVG